MAHTKRHKKSKSARKRTMRTNKKHQELYSKNRKRNSIIRNIRMGRSTFNRLGGGSSGYIRKDGFQQGGASQFIGSPWTVSNNPNTGNYFAPSPLGVGTGNVPKFNDGQPLNHGARWPTQLGPQLAKSEHRVLEACLLGIDGRAVFALFDEALKQFDFVFGRNFFFGSAFGLSQQDGRFDCAQSL